MRFSKWVVVLCGVIASLVHAGGSASSQPKAKAMPKALVFSFSHEYTLRKTPESVTLTWRPQWLDAQAPPPPEFDERPQTVTLNEAESGALLKALQRIDFATLRAPKDSDFVPSPPDLNQMESLFYSTDGAAVVDWYRDSAFLRDALRAPLLALTQQFRDAFTHAARRQKPQRPPPDKE